MRRRGGPLLAQGGPLKRLGAMVALLAACGLLGASCAASGGESGPPCGPDNCPLQGHACGPGDMCFPVVGSPRRDAGG